MTRERLEKLLQVYSLKEILMDLELDDVDVLLELATQGYMDNLTLVEPL